MKRLIILLCGVMLFLCSCMTTTQTQEAAPMERQRPPRGMRYNDITDFPAMIDLMSGLRDSQHIGITVDEQYALDALIEQAEGLRKGFLKLDEEYPDQSVVSDIKELKAACYDVLIGLSIEPYIYDYAEHSLTPKEKEFRVHEGDILFRTNTGGTDPWFGYQEHSFFAEAQPEPIEIPDGKKAFFLISYTGLQTYVNSVPVILGKNGRITSAAFFDLSVSRPANLYIQVDDEIYGEDMPFLLDIVDEATGEHLMPENALDIASQMDPSAEAIHSFVYPYAQNFPGEPKSHYYIVPGRVEQGLPSGTYTISIRRGIEHEVYRETVELEPGELRKITVPLSRWTDMLERGWVSGEGHMHGRIMSGTDASNLLDWTIAADVHVTNVLFMGNYMQTWFDQRGFGKEYRIAKDGYCIVPGQEDPRAWGGHVVGQNISELVRSKDEYLSYRNVYDAIHDQGGIVGGAHILSKEAIQGDRLAVMDMPWGRLDYYEILQVGDLNTDLYYDCLDLGMRMSPGSGTDVPWHGSIGEGRMYVFTGDGAVSPDAWFEGLREGHVFISNSAMLELTTDTGAIPGDTVTYREGDETVTFHGKAWSRGDGQYLSRVELIIHSKTAAEARIIDLSTEAEVEITLPVDKGFWCLLKATTTDGGYAMTSPIYIEREGYRFWNRDRVDEIVARYTETLDQYAAGIEADVSRFETYGASGPDHYSHKRGEQGSEFLGEIAETKEAFLQFSADLKHEQ